MKIFTHETVYEIYEILKEEIALIDFNEIVYFDIINPDMKEEISFYIPFKGYKAVTNLAEILLCTMTTPLILENHKVRIGFKKLNTTNSFHASLENSSEKYGKDSLFATINKNAEPTFVVPYIHALKLARAEKKTRILNLGINSGDEFAVIEEVFNTIDTIEFVGIDYCQSAIEKAQERFKDKENFKFYAHDINTLEELNLGTFDLIISIGTLQSSNLDFKLTFMNLIQNYLDKKGSLILGFPNCRWCDNEMIYGAKMPNYSFSEMTLLFKDVYFCKKYLQQKKFKVTLTGKEYVFLTANSLRN
ncbi:MAG: methyltransferase domain-containing protein [Arcobacteraceae bacterium]